MFWQLRGASAGQETDLDFNLAAREGPTAKAAPTIRCRNCIFGKVDFDKVGFYNRLIALGAAQDDTQGRGVGTLLSLNI